MVSLRTSWDARSASYQLFLHFVFRAQQEKEVAAINETVGINIEALQSSAQWLEPAGAAKVCHAIDKVLEENCTLIATVVESKHAIV